LRAVIQRVSSCEVVVAEKSITRIDQGLIVLLGIEIGDDQQKVDILAKKIANLRIFCDVQEKMNLSVKDIQGKAIIVSQFTLMADTRKGNRPSFIRAADPKIASPLVDYFVNALQSHGVETSSGEFGAHMLVKIHNDGPVTILLEV